MVHYEHHETSSLTTLSEQIISRKTKGIAREKEYLRPIQILQYTSIQDDCSFGKYSL